MGTKNKILLAVLASALLGAGCSKSSSSSDSSTAASTALTISGSLSASTVAASSISGKPQGKVGVGAMSYTVTDLKLYGVAISSSGITASTVDLGSDGSFSLTLSNGKGALITLLFIDKTSCSDAANPATCDTAGTVKFVDSSKKDINGNDKSSSSIALTGDVSLGNIAIATDGTVSIPVTQISTVASTTAPAAGTAFDFSGVWAASKYDGTLPAGYKTIKTLEEQMASGGEGGGPLVGMPITLIRLTGKEFTPGSGCTSKTSCAADAGTNGDDLFAISIWGGGITTATVGAMSMPSQLAACGSGGLGNTGFTDADARFNAHINLDAAPTISGQSTILGLQYADYNWASAGTGFGGDPDTSGDAAHPNNLPWMKTGAQPPMWWSDGNGHFRVQKCFAQNIGDSSGPRAWVCESYEDVNDNNTFDSGTDTNVWQAGLGGGCFDSNGKPVQVDNWSAMTGAVCSQVTDASLPAGFHTNSCDYTNVDPDGSDGITSNGTTVVNNPAMNFTCRNSGGMFTNSTLTTEWTPSGSNWHRIVPKEQIVTNCHEVSDTLTRYRCYAEAMESGGGGGGGPENWGSCKKDYRFNWGATTPETFVMTEGRNKPDAAFITNMISYSPDGTSASVYDERKEVRTVGGDGKEAFCPIVRTTEIKVTKVTDTKLLFDLTEAGRVEGLENAACAAAAKTEFKYEVQMDKMMFYMDKM